MYDPRVDTQYSNYIPREPQVELEYSLIISSINCPFSEKILELIEELDIAVTLDLYDVQTFLQNNQPLPNYIDGTPELIISEVQQMSGSSKPIKILIGYKQISNWLNTQIKKSNHSVGRIGTQKNNMGNGAGNFATIDRSHGHCRLQPPKVEFDEYNRPIEDKNMFSVPYQSKADARKIDIGSLEAERQQLDKQLGMAPDPIAGPPQAQQPRENNPPISNRRMTQTTKNNYAAAGGGGGNYAAAGGSGGKSSGGGGRYSAVSSTNNYAPIGK